MICSLKSFLLLKILPLWCFIRPSYSTCSKDYSGPLTAPSNGCGLRWLLVCLSCCFVWIPDFRMALTHLYTPGSLSWTVARPAFSWAASLELIVWIYVPHFTFICCFILLVIPGNENPDYISAVWGIPSPVLINLMFLLGIWILATSVALVLEGGRLTWPESPQQARLCPRSIAVSYACPFIRTCLGLMYVLGSWEFFHFLLHIMVCWPLRLCFVRIPHLPLFFLQIISSTLSRGLSCPQETRQQRESSYVISVSNRETRPL